jgi:hypothetical protein
MIFTLGYTIPTSYGILCTNDKRTKLFKYIEITKINASYKLVIKNVYKKSNNIMLLQNMYAHCHSS